MRVIPEIVFQHAEESAFCWLLRNHAVTEPHYCLSDLSRLDASLEAHLDGLRIAGDAEWGSAKENLGFREPGEVFTVSVLALDAWIEGEKRRLDIVTACFDGQPALVNGLISAMGWHRFENIESLVRVFFFGKTFLFETMRHWCPCHTSTGYWHFIAGGDG